MVLADEGGDGGADEVGDGLVVADAVADVGGGDVEQGGGQAVCF